MFGGGNKKRGFVRESVSNTEKTISYALLLLILSVGVAIYLKGQNFDPGLFALDQSYLQNAQEDTRESLRLYEPGFGPKGEITAIQTPETSPFTELAPEGWSQMGAEESFTADTLYEKINGRAEQYIRYGVEGMQFVSFSKENEFIDVFVYDMGNPIQAYGIYSVERTEGAPKTDLGRGGYQVKASHFFWKGAAYIQVIASTTEGAIIQATETVAKKMNERLEDNGRELWGFALLPQNNRVDDTVQYFKQDALSLDFLKNGFTARYDVQGSEVTAFIVQGKTQDEANQAFDKYTQYITDYGDLAHTETEAGQTLLVGDMGGLYDIVFKKENYVGGITLAEDREAGEKMVRSWLQNLILE